MLAEADWRAMAEERYRVVVQVGGHLGWRTYRTRRQAQRAWKMQVALPMEAGWLTWIEPDAVEAPQRR